MAAPTYDDSDWPLFRARMPATPLSETEFSAWLQRLDQLFVRAERFALMLDVRDAPLPTATERHDVAKLLNSWHARHPHRMAAQAVVLKSAVQRGVLTAILWLSGPIYPTRPFVRMADADAWLREMLRTRLGSGTHPSVRC
jgi:hypothetical protein